MVLRHSLIVRCRSRPPSRKGALTPRAGLTQSAGVKVGSAPAGRGAKSIQLDTGCPESPRRARGRRAAARRDAGGWSRPKRGILALALLLAAAPLTAASATAPEEERVPPGLLAAVEGRPLVPALTPEALGGETVSLAEDVPTIVHFFATWCAPCRTELPALAAFARSSGVRVLLVDVAEPADRILRFFAEGTAGATPGPVLLDQNRAAARAWGISLLPASFVVISGRLALAREGEVDWADPETFAAITAAAGATTRTQPKDLQGEQTR